ncbi:nucleotidyltransferase domain-containing protein [Mycolicibacterium palauense]|uniref:nucleotidyltransferase domain-containing protein n=1 Tax=Mycolicibacterium palauense TaxID=2034511 RepID=UPI001C3F4107|nr:nucleotidyltransferase domain-containing protein [Mycolicibacterium palauense]
MKTSTLLPILRSQMQGDLLALLYLHPEAEYSLTDAARGIGATVRAVHPEVERLVTAGLIQERRLGNLRLIRAADTRLTPPLTELLALTYGPIAVLPSELADVDGIREAFIFGSWARRYGGEPGPPPDDVDVLVVGTADLDDLDEAARRAERTLRRPVHITRVLPARWDSDERDGFLEDVRSKPRVAIDLGAEAGV